MKALIVALSLFVSACAVPLEKPRNMDDSLAYAVAQVTAVRLSCTDAAVAGRIEVDDERACLSMADEARAYIEMARLSTDPLQAETYLNKALVLLTALESVLKSMEEQSK